MAAPVAMAGLALLGGALALAVDRLADVLPAGAEAVVAPNASPAAGSPGAGAEAQPVASSVGALRLDRRALLLVVGLAGGAAAGYWLGLSGAALWLLGWGALLLLVAVIDFEHRLVLNKVLGVAGAVALGASAIGLAWAPPLRGALIGGVAGLALFALIAVVGRGAMGLGDVKLAGLIGLLLGFPQVFNALLLGVVFGGIAALAVILSGGGRKSSIAYAPWLSLGALVTLVQSVAAMPR